MEGAIAEQQVECRSRPIESDPVHPDAATGRIDIAEYLDVRSCASAQASSAYRWKLGEVPSELVGSAGEVTVLLRVRHSELRTTGDAATWGASIGLGIGGINVRRDWAIASVDCGGTQCTSQIPDPGVLILRKRFASMPKTLFALIDSDASVSSGTASVGVSIEGILQEVRVRSARGAPRRPPSMT
jgi:hypothetical protein